MTIETQVSKIRYAGDGAARVFPVPFPVRQAEHLRLYLASALGTEIVLESGYTVQGAGTDKVSVTLSAPLPSGKNLAIVRLVPLAQQMDLENGGSFDAETIERQFDITQMQIQQLQEQLDRTIKAPVTGDVDPDKLWKDLGQASQAALDAYAAFLRIVDPATLDSHAFNVRRSCLAEAAVPAGGLLTLPAWYYPGRGLLYLAVDGHVCTPRRPDDSGREERLYEEVGDDPGVLSNQARVWFPVEAGALVDVWVVASNLVKEMDRLEDAAEEAAQSAQSAAGSVMEAQGAADLAGEKAAEAAQSAAEAALAAQAGSGGPDSVPDASPAGRGLVCSGGAAGQVYRVNAAGSAYGWEDMEASPEIPLAAPASPGLAPAGGQPGQVYRASEDGDGYEWGSVNADTIREGILPIEHGGTGRTDGKAPAWTAARTIALTGDVTGSASFDGSANISIATTAAASASAPKPQAAAGVGQWVTATGGYQYTLPSGGTWAYSLITYDIGLGGIAGIAAGGAKINTGAATGGISKGFVWRIA